MHVLHKHALLHIEIHTQSQRTVHGQNKKHIFASQHLAKHVLALCIQLGAKAATSVCKTKTWPGTNHKNVRSSKKLGPILQICMFITGIDKILALAEDCLMQRHTEDTKACSSHNQSSSVTNCKLCNSLCYSMQACFIGSLSDMYLSGKHCSCWGCCTCTAVEHESFHSWSEGWIVELI